VCGLSSASQGRESVTYRGFDREVVQQQHENGGLSLMKGRLVASGNEVDPSLYTRDEVSSPTVSSLSIMPMMAAASYHHADIGAIDFPTLGKNRYMWLRMQRRQFSMETHGVQFIPNQTLTSEESLWPRGGWNVNVLERDSDSMNNIELIVFGSCDNGLANPLQH
jgi:hypothetical protein